MLFDLLKAFDKIESGQKSDFFAPIRPIFLHACATCSELPSNISSMEVILFYEMKSIIFYTIQISCYSSERKKRKHGKIFTQ